MELRNLWWYCRQNRLQVCLCSLSMAIAVLCMHLIGFLSFVVKSELLYQMELMGTDLVMGFVYDDRVTRDMFDGKYSFIASEVLDAYTVKFVDPSYFDLYQMECYEGRLLSVYDENCVVVGQGVSDYGVGDVFVYDHQLYEVVGVLQEVSESFYGDDNLCMFMPYKSNFASQWLMMGDTRALEYVLSDNEYDIFSQAMLKEGMKELLDLLQSVLYIIGCVSFVVCMVGILNVTWLSVNHRYGEIGIRRAIGGSFLDVCKQLLLEVVCMGMVGYVLGSVLSVFCIFLLSRYLQCLFYMNLILGCVLLFVCLFVGVFSGIFPVLIVCKKDVVELLKL